MFKFGIVQYPKKLSMSEKIFNEYFQKINMDAVYEGLNINPDNFDIQIQNILNE